MGTCIPRLDHCVTKQIRFHTTSHLIDFSSFQIKLTFRNVIMVEITTPKAAEATPTEEEKNEVNGTKEAPKEEKEEEKPKEEEKVAEEKKVEEAPKRKAEEEKVEEASPEKAAKVAETEEKKEETKA